MNIALEAKVPKNVSSSAIGAGGSTIFNSSEVFDPEWFMGDLNLEPYMV